MGSSGVAAVAVETVVAAAVVAAAVAAEAVVVAVDLTAHLGLHCVWLRGRFS